MSNVSSRPTRPERLYESVELPEKTVSRYSKNETKKIERTCRTSKNESFYRTSIGLNSNVFLAFLRWQNDQNAKI